MTSSSMMTALKREWALGASLLTSVMFAVWGKAWLKDISNPAWFSFILLWLFIVMLSSAFAIVHHAEGAAAKLGEPLGTLVLTLSVIGIEVMMISAVMITSGGKPTLARDTMYAIIMLALNGVVGLSLLLGGLRHHEQHYNLRSAQAFLALIIPLSVLGLVLPNFTRATPGPTLSPFQSVFLSLISLAVYGIFLVAQNRRHREFFISPQSAGVPSYLAHDEHHGAQPLGVHIALLLAYLGPLVLLSKQIAVPIDHGIRVLGAPATLGGFLVATLVFAPESLSAMRAAVNNHLQRAINLLLGSVLASIGLTIPAVSVIGLLTGQTVILGLDAVGMIMLVLTLAVSMMTFATNRTNILLGAVHLVLFGASLMLIFER